MARIRSTAKISTLTSSEALQRDKDSPNIVAPILKVVKASAELKKRKVDEAVEEGII
jgi:hypothetical protein